jgi:hypothetical protein
MVDITNPSLVPSYDPIDLQQQALDTQTDATDMNAASAPEAEPEPESASIVNVQLVDGEIGLGDEEKRKEKEKKQKNDEAALTSRYSKPQRSFDTSALRDQLSQRLQQSPTKSTFQPNTQTQLGQIGGQANQTGEATEGAQQMGTDGLVSDGFAQFSKPKDQTQVTSKPYQVTSNIFQGQTSTSSASQTGQNLQQDGLVNASGQDLATPTGVDGFIAGKPASDNLASGKPSAGEPGKPNVFSEPGKPGKPGQPGQTSQSSQSDQLAQPRMTPRQFPSPLGGRPSILGSTPRQFSSSGQVGQPGQPGQDGIAKAPVFAKPQGLPASSAGFSTPGLPATTSTPGQIGQASTDNSGNIKGTESADALSQSNAKGAFGSVVNKPISLFGEKSAFSQPTLAGNDKEQVKQALATKYPVFATLPVATQNAIAEVFVNQPDLPIEMGETFIQLAETNSFQKLASNDKATVFKMFGALMQSPLFNNFNDGRIGQLLNDIAGGFIDFQVYRSPGGEPGKSDSTGFALNLSSPEVASALADALKGDSSKLVNILLNLGKQVPALQAQDQTWQTLMSQPDFKDLATGQQEIYQTVKQFPGADAKKLIEYVQLPSAKFLAATPGDRANELKLVAAVNTSVKEGEVKETNGESPAKTTGSGLRLAGLPAGKLDGSGPTQQMPLDQLIQEGTVNVELYRANDGKKNVVDGNNIKLNIADPSVQRSLSTDGKLAAGAVSRFSGVAAQNIDEKIKDLNKTPGFRKLDDETKRLIASALKEHPNADPEELLKFSESPNYTEVPQDKSKREKAQLMRMVASLLHQYADNPKQLAMLYNSLQRLFNNDIKFNGFMNDSKYVSNNQSGGVSINSKWVENEKEAAATFVREVNHALHERPNITWGGTIAFFANEYRAAYTEALFRTNATPEPEHMRQIITVLLSDQPSSVYAHLRNTLDTDPVFSNLVSWINEKLDNDEVIKPEELRQTLLSMVGKSPNIPSEEPFQDSWFVDNESPFPDAAAVLAEVSRQIPFDKLSAKEQAVVINLVRKYDADPQVFHQLMQLPRFQEAEETEKTWLLRLVGGLSSEAAKEGKGSPAHRTLNQLLGNKVEIAFYQSDTDSRLQHIDKNVLNINLTESQSVLMDDWIAGLNDSIIESVVGVRK